MYAEADKKITEQFEGLDVESLSDGQIVRFFQQLDLFLDKDGNLKDLCKLSNLTSSIKAKLLTRVKILCDNPVLDELNNQFKDIPERFKNVITDYLVGNWSKTYSVELTKFGAKIVANDKFVAVADNSEIKIFSLADGQLIRQYNTKQYIKFCFTFTTLTNQFVIFAQEDQTVKALFYNDFCIDKIFNNLSFCPSYVKHVIDDVFQFIEGSKVGNIVFRGNDCDFNYFNLSADIPKPGHQKIEFEHYEYVIEGDQLLVKVKDYNYNLLQVINRKVSGHIQEQLKITTSLMFKSMPEVLRREFVQEINKIFVNVNTNEKFFKF